jgi:uncharacterized protein (TIGR03083 family)
MDLRANLVRDLGPPLDVRSLFESERQDLLQLLRSLSDDDWWLPTVCGDWSVHDVALHLFGANVNILAGDRDSFRGSPLAQSPGDLSNWATLVAFIDQRNEAWVDGLRRMSPRLVTELIDWSGTELAAYWPTLNLEAMGMPVNWAGSEPAPTWLHVARELTERWTHQQHIRLATHRPGGDDPEMLHAVLDTFVRAMPFALRDIRPDAGRAIRLRITGNGGGSWLVQGDGQTWRFVYPPDAPATSEVSCSSEDAWQAFTRGFTPSERRARMRFSGDPLLAERIVDMVSIIG